MVDTIFEPLVALRLEDTVVVQQSDVFAHGRTRDVRVSTDVGFVSICLISVAEQLNGISE